MKTVSVRVNFATLRKLRLRLECPSCFAIYDLPADKIPESLTCCCCDAGPLYAPLPTAESEGPPPDKKEAELAEKRGKLAEFVERFTYLLQSMPGFLPDGASQDSFGGAKLELRLEAEIPEDCQHWLEFVSR